MTSKQADETGYRCICLGCFVLKFFWNETPYKTNTKNTNKVGIINQKQIAEKCKYLKIKIPVYLEDFNFEKEYTDNNLPCGTKNGEWQVTIDIDNHNISEWKKEYGKLRIFSKVVDEGAYSLLDENKKEFYRIEGYVPNHILPEKDGFGDYLTIDLNSRNTADFYVNSDYAKLQFHKDLNRFAPLINVFYLRYQGREQKSRYQKLEVVNMYSVVKIYDKGFKVNALHKTFNFDTNFDDENLQTNLITKFVDKLNQVINSEDTDGCYYV